VTHKDHWQSLEDEAHHYRGEGILKRMIGNSEPCPIYIGLRQPDRTRVFILQSPKECAPLSDAIPESKGFKYEVLFTGDEVHNDFVSIILSASGQEYNDVFISIAEDLFSKLKGLQNNYEIVQTFVNRVRIWQLFFANQNPDGLSEAAQKGLYGELVFLKSYLLKEVHPDKAVRYWTGPKRRQHDFQFGPVAVEVKTSSAKKHLKLHISSEQQLDETQVEKLFLCYFSVALIENSKDTLPLLVKDIRKLLEATPLALSHFNNSLLESGYLDIHTELYSETGYSIRDSGFFIVEGDFPRIRECELRKGVGELSYTIDLDVCSSYEIDKIEFRRYLKSG